jgi:hypothetical protein
MRVVLDSCVPRTLLRHLGIPDATTVGDLGWADLDDGPLLDRVAAVCDVFVTADRNLAFQQRLDGRAFATVVLAARTTRVVDLLPLVDGIRAATAQARPGEVVRVPSDVA